MVEGAHVWGPPDATSFTKGPAGSRPLKGHIDGNTIRYQNEKGTTKYAVILTGKNQMLYTYADAQGRTTSRTLRPLWMLVEAERKARH